EGFIAGEILTVAEDIELEIGALIDGLAEGMEELIGPLDGDLPAGGDEPQRMAAIEQQALPLGELLIGDDQIAGDEAAVELMAAVVPDIGKAFDHGIVVREDDVGLCDGAADE